MKTLNLYLLTSASKLAILWHAAGWWSTYNPWIGMIEEQHAVAEGNEKAVLGNLLGRAQEAENNG